MTSPQTPTVEVLLADVKWVRGLARGLARDAVLGEDAAQEVWLSALRRTAAPRSTLRAWLAGATRHAVLKAYRSEGRRRAHEELAAKPERIQSTAQVVEGLSTQLSVAQAVHELQEPYRETILLRYYEDLPLKEIAVRMDAPLATV
ncbi:MAG: RNA polymerase sigma factor, partial [Planctomycetota bacterium]